MILRQNIKTITFFIFLFSTLSLFSQNNGKFKVVLDAGHGGKDFGANYHSHVEKKIVLAVVLKVGDILEKYSDIQVVYTRKTDVFIELDERASIANRANANLFLSIHCNAAKSPNAYGTETFVMGLTKNASNLEVAKKENSVITLEDNYKVKYEGFDPNSPESKIGISLLQEEFLNQSITLASKVQDQFTNKLQRKNRGVKSAPFWVLHRTSMPSILTELGFISYDSEGKYLSSEKGQDEIASSIANAVLSYKKEFYSESKADREEVKPKKEDVKKVEENNAIAENKEEYTNSAGVVFKIQISASGTSLETSPSNFKGLELVTVTKEGSLYKYYYTEVSDYNQAKKNLQEAKSKGFESAFIIALKNGKKISIQEALKYLN